MKVDLSAHIVFVDVVADSADDIEQCARMALSPEIFSENFLPGMAKIWIFYKFFELTHKRVELSLYFSFNKSNYLALLDLGNLLHLIGKI